MCRPDSDGLRVQFHQQCIFYGVGIVRRPDRHVTKSKTAVEGMRGIGWRPALRALHTSLLGPSPHLQRLCDQGPGDALARIDSMTAKFISRTSSKTTQKQRYPTIETDQLRPAAIPLGLTRKCAKGLPLSSASSILRVQGAEKQASSIAECQVTYRVLPEQFETQHVPYGCSRFPHTRPATAPCQSLGNFGFNPLPASGRTGDTPPNR